MQPIKYFLKRPKGTNVGYSIVAYKPVDRNKKEYITLPEKIKASLDSINKKYKQGILKDFEAELMCNDLIFGEYKKSNTLNNVMKESAISEANMKVFESFWRDEYEHRYLADFDSPRYNLKKAIRLIEPLSLTSATQAELQNQIKKNSRSTAEIRNTTNWINMILRHLNRGFELQKPHHGILEISFLRKSEFDQVITHLKSNSRNLAVTLFATGLRLSEAFSLTSEDIVGKSVMVNKQLTKKGETKLPKRNKVGRSAILSWGIPSVKAWARQPNKEQFRFKFFDELQSACRKAFPHNSKKWISPHDLRHSHAIYLLEQGATLTEVALNLRNRIEVCQKYYTGFAHSEGTLDNLMRKI